MPVRFEMPVAPTDAIYLSDCDDSDQSNAHMRMRQGVRSHSGLRVATFVDASYPHGAFGAGAHFVDGIEGNRQVTQRAPRGNSVFLNNCSPRALTLGKTMNGRKICWTIAAGHTLYTGTFDPEFFRLSHRLGLVSGVHMLSTRKILDWGIEQGELTVEQAFEMELDQFRGAKLIPWVMAMILEYGTNFPVGGDISEWVPLGEIVYARGVVARLDSRDFGPNVYTDVLMREIDLAKGFVRLANGLEVPLYSGLAKIEDNTLGAAPGSSGYGQDKFLMFAVMGGSATRRLADILGKPIDVGAHLIDPSFLITA